MKKALLIAAMLCIAAASFSLDMTGFGINGGVGTDISLGIGVGGGASYVFFAGGLAYEVGLMIYYAHSDVSAPDGPMGYIYRDVTTSLLFGAAFNMLFKYDPGARGLFFLAGTGAGAVSVSWEGSSVDDPTYNDSWDRMAGGMLVNPGMGYTFGNGLELRLQIPVLIVFGGAVNVMLNANVGYRF